MNHNLSKPDIWFVYDGECPICQMGANFFKVREGLGQLHTVNARSQIDHPVMQEINAARMDLDKGMVIKYEGKLYQGDAALHLMAYIGSDSGLFNRINRLLFRSKILSVACYPFMRGARNLALKLKGVDGINNMEQ
jgi:predicted DCC family thiol-disulfide oxidoreductase YuxK